jgi:polysaccharide pyruvyl transferase WcaK-like protein
VGPLGNSQLTHCIARLLRLSSVRIFRDEQSRDAAIALGAGSEEDTVAGDPARDWFGKQRPIASSSEAEGPRLLLALRDWPAEQYSDLPRARAAEVKAEFEARLLQLLREVIRRVPDVTLVPFAMCSHHIGGDDRWFYRRLLRAAPDLLANTETAHLTRQSSPREACSLFAGSDATLCMRFHATMLSAEMGKPLLALDYTGGRGKVAALSKALGFEAMGLEQLEVDAAATTVAGWLDQPTNVDYPSQPAFGKAFAEAIAHLQGGQAGA